MSRRATATSAGRNWHIGGGGLLSRTLRAVAEDGALEGEFDPRGGDLRWNQQAYELRPASTGHERYALVVGETEVAGFESNGRGRKPIKVEIVRPEAVEPGLLLFAAFVIRGGV